MRDPSRIDRFCARLAKAWANVPDWRFGQLISNALGGYGSETGRDIFFSEDDELFDYIKKYIETITNSSD